MKKLIGLALSMMMLLTLVGCAQKSESEKLADQMKKASNEMKEDMHKTFN